MQTKRALMIRIIAGEKKGFVLKTPRGTDTRPTLGRVRESLFNILRHEVVGATVLDLYAGAGSLGLEALSRGASHCTFVEQADRALAALQSNIAKLSYEQRCRVFRANVLRWLEMQKSTGWPRYHLVFSDPPYDSGDAARSLEYVAVHLPFEPSAVVVIQASPREELAESYARLRRFRKENYGDTSLHFYVATGED
ncbi:MAG: 16S rRNA (guanine(966)-N(2))-methyltransferase RsmD [Candidatus Sumerlaeaceae bacterium]